MKSFQAKYQKSPLGVLRERLMNQWRRNVCKSFLVYLTQEHGSEWIQQTERTGNTADLLAGHECLWCTAYASWWDWTVGSRPFYWRWLAAHRQAAQDGYPPFIQSELPRYNRPQPFERNADTRQKVKEKLSAVRMKRYIDKGEVKSLTSYFGFPRETPT